MDDNLQIIQLLIQNAAIFQTLVFYECGSETTNSY